MNIQKLVNAITTYYHVIELTLKGVSMGKHMRFCGRIIFKIERNSKVRLGSYTVLSGGMFINALGCNRGCCIHVDEGAELSIGNYCGLSDVTLRARKKIIIGNYVMVGANTIFNDSNSHSLDYIERRKERKIGDGGNITHQPIVVKDDVFIGSNCIICKGVTIGERSIIAAGSVVVKDVPSDEVWGGNPARFIKKIMS